MSNKNTSLKMIARREASDNLKLFATPQEQLTSDDYYTPPEFFEQLGLQFDLDVASPSGGCHWIPAKNYYDQEKDGLASDWFGMVFMNPPFSETAIWATKFVNHGCGVAIVPVTRAHWFNRLWHNPDVGFAIPFQHNGLFKFIKNGKRVGVYMPVIVIGMGKEARQAISRIGFVR